MEPQLTDEIKKDSDETQTSGDEATLSLQEGLVAAIHGAFEVAMNIAVKEVKKLVGEITGDKYEEMRRENELLKQRLQRAEAMLDMRGRGGNPTPTEQLLNDTPASDQPHHPEYSHISLTVTVGDVQACKGVSHIHAHQPDETQDTSVNRSDGQTGDGQLVTNAATNTDEQQSYGFTTEITHAYEVKVETINQPLCQHPTAQDHHLAPLPSADNTSTLEPVRVKQEQPEKKEEEEEEERDGCCLDSIKVEDFGLECMSAVQSQMLEDWEPGVLDTESQDPDSQMSSSRLAQAHPTNMITGLEPPTDLPSLPSELPVFQLAEPAPIPDAPPQICGVHVRTNRQLANTVASPHACKCCGQTFHLPSLLRRHYSQCPQKLQQRCLQPVVGGKRTRLQLYPPGCSPFRCSECNREFNRMENLKTHLRIHTGERPYTCSVCSKCFRHSGALTRHFRIHTGEKPYICGQCGKSFRNCGGLKFHQRSHSKPIQ